MVEVSKRANQNRSVEDNVSSESNKWREAEEKKYGRYWSRHFCTSSETCINVWQFFTQNVTYFLAEEEKTVIAFFSKADKNGKANLWLSKLCFEESCGTDLHGGFTFYVDPKSIMFL